MEIQDIYILFDNLRNRSHQWLLNLVDDHNKSNRNNPVLIFIICLLGLEMPEISCEMMIELLSMVNKYWSVK